MDKILDKKIPVLDHGFVVPVDYMGDERDIVSAARVSYGNGTKTKREDAGLIRYLISHWHCYHGDMSVLTVNGWKKWKDCGDREKFLVPNPQSGKYSIETLAVKQFDHEGNLFCFKNSRMNYAVTEDHSMYFKGKYEDGFNKVKVQEKSNWGHFRNLHGLKIDSNSSIEDIAKWNFIGFYLGDGYDCSVNRVSFHLKKGRKIEYLENLLRKLELQFSRAYKSASETFSFSITKPEWFHTFIEEGVKAKDKKLLAEIPLGYHENLLEGLIASDGHVKIDRDQTSFHSTSPDLLNLFETIAALSGYQTKLLKCKKTVVMYTGSDKTIESRKHHHFTKFHKGKVFCATTSTGWLAVRGENGHGFICGNTSPLEMCELKVHMKLPIFVARQLIRHRTANVNEYSARYSVMQDEFYIPEPSRVMGQGITNKQGSEGKLSDSDILWWLSNLEEECNRDFDVYKTAVKKPEIDDPTGIGIARETARIGLPVNVYTQWYWKIDLNNLLKFLLLRSDSHAQWEIQQYSNVLLDILRQWCPNVYQAFMDYQFKAYSLSAPAIEVVKALLDGEKMSQKESGLNEREWNSLMGVLGQ